MKGAANHSIKLHSTQPIKEINFFHFVDFHFVLLNEMEGIKMYYNSNCWRPSIIIQKSNFWFLMLIEEPVNSSATAKSSQWNKTILELFGWIGAARWVLKLSDWNGMNKSIYWFMNEMEERMGRWRPGRLVHSTSSFSSSINSIQSKTFDWLIDWLKRKEKIGWWTAPIVGGSKPDEMIEFHYIPFNNFIPFRATNLYFPNFSFTPIKLIPINFINFLFVLEKYGQ